MARYEPRVQPGLQALIRNHSQKSLEICQQLLVQMSTQEKALVKCRGVIKFETNMWRVVPPPAALQVEVPTTSL